MTELLVPFLILILGLILLAAEDLLPTSGILGIFAFACFVFLLYLGFSRSIGLGIRYLAAEVVLGPLTYGLSSYLIGRSRLGRAAFLQPPEAHEVDLAPERPDLDRFLGQRGRVLTPLRPTGTVEFESRRLEGIAEEGLIEAGVAVIAVRIRSGRLMVRADRLQESAALDE